MDIVLRPPVLPGTMPAFTAGQINIPFSMNRSVASAEVQGFALKIRTAQGKLIDTLILDLSNKNEDKLKYINNGIVPFSIDTFGINLETYEGIDTLEGEPQKFMNLFHPDNENKLLISVFYKFQLAYCSIGSDGKLIPGYYSTITVGKYTSDPKLTISGLESYPNKNDSQYTYTGVYSQSNDYLKVNEEAYFEEFFNDINNFKVVHTTRLTNVDIAESKRTITLGNKRMCYWTKRTQIAGTFSENNVVKEELLLAQAQERDESEKLYSSKLFILTDKGEIYYESSEQLHNTLNDNDSRTAKETFAVVKELPKNKIYYLIFKITTRNGLEVSSEKYRIVNKTKTVNEFQGSVTAKLNTENAYIDIDLVANNDYEFETGHFVISRQASNEPDVWRELYRFDLNREIPSRHIWKDFTIEQGVTYTYAIQQYSLSDETHEPNIYTERIKSNSVLADFEYTYLFDGDRQLKIKFDPKVSSFKADLLENKVDTIGGKYPIIYRNGSVNYKEFPISGLISYLTDDEGIFYSGLYKILEANRNKTAEDIKTNYELATDLTAKNFTDERAFKLAVLDWLNNGKPKLFKSPSEGNYIVRLINTSLSPTDSLGRMLHSFSTQAYEVADNSYDNLVNFDIINFNIIDRKQKNYHSFDLHNINNYNQDFIIKCEGFIHRDDKIIINDANNVIYKIVEKGTKIIKEDEDFQEFSFQSEFDETYLEIYCRSNLRAEIPHAFSLTLTTVVPNLSLKYSAKKGQVIVQEQPIGNYKKTYYVSYSIPTVLADCFIPLKEDVTNFKITDVMPETLIKVNGQSYMVGPTGTFNYEGAVTELGIQSPQNNLTGNIYLEYWGLQDSFTDLISDTQLIECPRRQFYGIDRDIDIIKDIEDVRTSLVDIYNLHFHKKNTMDIFNYLTFNSDLIKKEAQLTYSHEEVLKDLQKSTDSKIMDKQLLYYSDLKADGLGYIYYYYYDETDGLYYAAARYRVYDADACTYTYPDTSFLYYYYDKKTDKVKLDTSKTSSPFSFAVNSKIDVIDFDLVQNNDYLFNCEDLGVKTIRLNFGLNLEISYLIRETTYKIEKTNEILINSKKNYLKTLENFKNALIGGEKIANYVTAIKKAYNLYLNNLTIELKAECADKNIELGRTQESKKLL